MGSEVVLGSGVGLRPTHYPFILENRPKVDWFEVVTENYIDTQGRPLAILKQIRENYPIALHGVSLSIGSTDPLNKDYLQKLKKLIAEIQPVMVSDHLCWTGVEGENLHDLLPIPYTEEALAHVVSRVLFVQEFLGRSIVLENPSSYISFAQDKIPEWKFLSEVSKQTDCKILLDVNNVYVNAFNHKFSAENYLQNIPKNRVAYFHLAGHRDMGSYYFDTHDGSIIEPVWNLYRQAVKRFPHAGTLVEWDAKIPDFPVLLAEVNRARKIQHEIAHA